MHVKIAQLTKFVLASSSHRNDTIQKWYDKTRVATGRISRGFSAFDQSALKQIQQVRKWRSHTCVLQQVLMLLQIDSIDVLIDWLGFYAL